MAIMVNMHKAKTELSKLVAKALAGEEVIITRSGKPVVKLSPIPQKRQWGGLEGEVVIHDDFNDPMPEDWLRQFYEGPIFPEER